MPIGRENLSVEHLALAYQLAVGSHPTNRIMEVLLADHSYLTHNQVRDVMLAVIELRMPDDEFIMGDRVRFTHENEQITGEICDIVDGPRGRCFGVATERGYIYSAEERYCVFA